MSQAARPFTNVGHVEEVVRTFNFSPGLAVGETLIAGSATCEIDVLIGSDPDAATRLLDGPDISGVLVSVLVGNFLEDVTYRIRVDVHTTNEQLLSCWTSQKCVGP